MSATALRPVPPARLSPRERLDALCDPGSLQLLRSRVLPRRAEPRAGAGDGVLAGTGSVGGRPIACYAQDGAVLGGSIGEQHAETIVRLLAIAARGGLPVVGFVESGGARIGEGTAALAGYGRIFAATVGLSARVPQIAVVSGASAGGGAYSPALTDLVVMTADAAMFLTGPGVVREALGETVDAAALGGPGVHEGNGVCALVAPDVGTAARTVRDLLGYLPSILGRPAPVCDGWRPPDAGDPSATVPAEPRRIYDVRSVVGAICDAASVRELHPRWARNVVSALGRLEGRPVALVANQPRHLGGVLDAAASEKAARFVAWADRIGLPVIAFVDTPGFMPGSRQEQAGIIRHGADLVRAFAAARVPKLTLVLRKAYGGAYITMNSRDLGSDLVLAWPGSELGIMSARAAVGITERRRLRVAEDPDSERERLAAAYAQEHLRVEAAAAGGFVDEIVAPADTRLRLAGALRALCPTA